MSNNVEKAPNVPAFVRFLASSIPMVFDDSMDYYEALANLVHYIQDTVDVVNNNATITEESITLINGLQDYMDHYFDNLDVQSEINNKLDSMVDSGQFQQILSVYVDPKLDTLEERIQLEIDNETTNRINSDNQLQSQISSLASGSPLVASSTSGMTDTTKVYVNTTDGKWYYYNGSAWTAGGTYQSSGLAANSVGLDEIDNKLSSLILLSSTDIGRLGGLLSGATASAYRFTTPIIIKAGTTLTFSSDFVANYHWVLRRLSPAGTGIATNNANINTLSTDTTYEMPTTEYCVICWSPIDNNWETETYTVDKTHNLDNSDLTSFQYYYPFFKGDMTNVGFTPSDLVSNLFGATIYTNITTMDYNRISCVKAFKSDYDLIFKVKSGYRYYITYWSDGTDSATRTYESSWNTTPTIIPKNTWFKFTISNTSNTSLYDLADYTSIFSLDNYEVNETASDVTELLEWSNLSQMIEIGNLNLGTNPPTYGVSTSRARTMMGTNLKLKQGDIITLQSGWVAYYGWYDNSGVYSVSTGWISGSYIVPQDGFYYFVIRKNPEENITLDEAIAAVSIRHRYNILDDIQNFSQRSESRNFMIKSFNHRGYSRTCPENTAPAFKRSAEMGFDGIETDIRFTSDGVAVLLHDDTINRTARNADGTTIDETIYIADITYEQALEYDFGIYMGEQFAGTKIMTFEQLMVLCKVLALDVHAELKYDTHFSELLAIVEKYAMKDHVTWSSLFLPYIELMHQVDPTASLCYLCLQSPSQSDINRGIALKGNNKMWFGVQHTTGVDYSYTNQLAQYGIEVFLYTPNFVSFVNDNLPPLTTGICSDWMVGGKALYDWNMGYDKYHL